MMDKFKWPEPTRNTVFPIARAGYPFIFAGAFTTAVLALLGLTGLTLISLLATFLICFFFRDPDRIVPQNEGAVVSPADGKVIVAEKIDQCPFLDEPCLKVSIFMTVFNVHVNRMVHEGTVTKVLYYPGKFFSANLDKASRHNEHNAVFLQTSTGKQICVVQIAGLIARRIICHVQKDEQLERGQRYGMICFGSRLDVYLPVDTRLSIAVGDKIQAGTSVIGYLS